MEGEWNGRSIGCFSSAFGAKKTKVPKEEGRGEWGGREDCEVVSHLWGELWEPHSKGVWELLRPELRILIGWRIFSIYPPYLFVF